MKKHPAPGAHSRARTLRQDMTEAEKAVWRMLRSAQIDGYRFRRQVPIGHYIADFVCHEARLIIEIDGGQHEAALFKEMARSQFLKSQGYRVLRFWNNDVSGNLEGVRMTIAAELRQPHPHPTLPHRGGGLSGASFEWSGFGDFSAEVLYEVLHFRQAIFVVEQASPYPDLDGCDQPAQHLLLRVDRELAGYLRLIPYSETRRVAIGRVAVAQARRGRGLARLLMDEALARCRRDHPEWTVTLGAQLYLAPFYENLGFRRTSEPYDDYGVPHVDMELPHG